MFGMHGGRGRGHGCGPRGGRPEMDVERFFHWIERLNEGERGRGGRVGGRRMFDGGELRLVLLKLIADAPRHGYDLIRAIEEMTGGAYAPSPGVVYPTLTLLGEMGLIEEQQSDGAKKRFGVTDAGRQHLADHAEQVAGLIARLEGIGARRGAWDETPVRRAFGNLRMVIGGVRMGGYSADKLHEIAALLDEVAQKIERLK